MQRRTSLRFAHDRPHRTGTGLHATNLPPTVSITAPANNSVVTVPATVHVTVNAADSDGSITQVQFHDPAQLTAQIEQSARNNQLDSELIHAVIHAESAFKTQATSHKGAQGLMQLMPTTVTRLGMNGVAFGLSELRNK